MDDTSIRRFQPTDREELVALWRRCDLARPWNDPDRDIDRKLAVDDGLLLVAVGGDGSSVIGSVMAGYEGHRGWINYLAVDPTLRRSGLGRRLMAAAQDRLVALGCPKVNLQIRRSNTGAVAFYEKLGYVEDDVISMGRRLVNDQES